MIPFLAIPIYDHGESIGDVVKSVSGLNLPCIIVDDGSGPATRAQLDFLEAQHEWVEVIRHPRNLGRGAALRTAYRTAASRGLLTWYRSMPMGSTMHPIFHDSSRLPAIAPRP